MDEQADVPSQVGQGVHLIIPKCILNLRILPPPLNGVNPPPNVITLSNRTHYLENFEEGSSYHPTKNQ